ncbi:type I secretion system permease/ATPase [Acuticoccus sp. MNP-M23]|uniref:type I secretion system permease/ATPase n=1 Tax=Acuticoccus sp. MNP-M23 TaxID=3072793 RepID=UPI002815A29F|nr:type I secretion system permease/ATPase [Acuticoccus sp. MNP-M23]WMS44376.1 type I secretion system permease/ATPase [Acuticoccus sp. MNP-M23]
MATRSNPVSEAVRQYRYAFGAIFSFSLLINLLMLTGPLFMLQIYDRVLVSRHVETLAALFLLVIGLYAAMALLEVVRARILSRLAARLDNVAGRPAFLRTVLCSGMPADAGRDAVRDLDRVRQFVSSSAMAGLFDMPWLPIYLAIVYLIHPALGLLATAGAVVLLVIALVTDLVTRPLVRQAGSLSGERAAMVESGRRGAEALTGMGMEDAIGRVWDRLNARFVDATARAGDAVGLSAVLSKTFRLFLQSAMLALGAYLAIGGAISAGAMIAASIIMARGLQPVEMAVQNWRHMLGAHDAYSRLKLATSSAPLAAAVALPAPRAALQVDNLSVSPGEGAAATLTGVSLAVECGTALGVIGHSGSGKSTLARALVGVWPAQEGTVMLDGAPLPQWIARGEHVGYLPQDVELMDGTVAENIARFQDAAPDDAVVAAAMAAGCHALILSLPDGYGTRLGGGGRTLSAGQRQRIALARALYGDPFLLVLDEPNSNLDGHGDTALNRAILGAKARGAAVVVVAHRPSALSAMDRLALIENGALTECGPRDVVLKALMRRDKTAAAPRAEAADATGSGAGA